MTGNDLADRYDAARRNPGLAVLEGFHAVKHALRFGADLLEMVTPDPERLARLAGDLAPDLAARMAEAAAVPPGSFDSLGPRPIPTPLAAIAARPEANVTAMMAGAGPLVLLDRPNHLGNIGAVVRVAAAAAADGVITTGDRDPWDPAALRGAAGLHFALPVARVDRIPASDRPLVAVDAHGVPLQPGALPSRPLLAFGSERSGLSPELKERAAVRVAIPMRPGVSSLNLATAVAIVLYSRAPPGPGGT